MQDVFTTLQLAALALIAIAVVCTLYEMLKMRKAFTKQRAELTRAISIVKDFQHLHPGMITLLQRLDSAGGAREIQKAELQELSKRIDAREEQLAQSGARICAAMDTVLQNFMRVERKPDSDSAMMRKGFLSNDPQLRFNVLKDWLAKNSLAILRRAAHDWRTAEDLIAIIPATLEAEAEIVDGRVLLVGTRDYSEKHAITISDLDPSLLGARPFALAAGSVGNPDQRRLIQ